MTTFLDLQNGWYNGFLQGMGQVPSTFQILQPSPPIVSASGNTALWAYFDNIPPASLVSNYTVSGGNSFYSDYRALMSALIGTQNQTFEQAVGKSVADDFTSYLQALQTPPQINTYSSLYRSWAMMHAPSTAVSGAAFWANILLDPVAAAQTVLLMSYTDSTGAAKAFTWSQNFSQLVAALGAAPSRSFNFSSSTMNSNVSNTWAQSSGSSFLGLFGGSSGSSSSLNSTFASSNVTVSASFDHVTTFGPAPGSWYNSGAMGLAFANKTGAPWAAANPINWANTFGSSGNMQRFAGNIIVASGMRVKVTSSAKYSTVDQTTIKKSGSHGFWPFHSGSSGSSSTNTVKFDEAGSMTIETTSAAGIPVVLGCNVLSAGDFTGHASASANAMVSASRSLSSRMGAEEAAPAR